jgi:aerobic carbon-monoxide dehydrogenase medium subunit
LLSPSAADVQIAEGMSDNALAEIAQTIVKDMNPMATHQGRADTKRRQAAVLLARLLKDLSVQAIHG